MAQPDEKLEENFPDTRGMPLKKPASNGATFLCCMYKYPHCLLSGRRTMREFFLPSSLSPARASRRMHLVAGQLGRGNLEML